MKIEVSEGKYAVEVDDRTSAMTFYRNGEPWAAGQSAFAYSGFVLGLLQEIEKRDNELAQLVHPHDLAKFRGQA